MVLKVYVDFLSQPARAVALFVKKTKIPHEIKKVSIMKGIIPEINHKSNFSEFFISIYED